MRGRPVLRVLEEPAGIDLGAAERAAGQFLTALGISLDTHYEDDSGRPVSIVGTGKPIRELA